MPQPSRRKARDGQPSRIETVSRGLDEVVARSVDLEDENARLRAERDAARRQNAFLEGEIKRLEIDTTTGLFRVAAEDVLPIKEADQNVDIIVMDLFGLKTVNEYAFERYTEGNRLLRKAGHTVMRILRDQGYPPRAAARIGGDEIAAFVRAGEGWQIAIAIQHTFGIVQMPTILGVDCISALVCASSGHEYGRFVDAGHLTEDGRVPQYPKFFRAATIMQSLKNRMKEMEVAEGRLVARTSYHNAEALRAEDV
jgi:GGDEF domain-containing protein